MSIVIDDAEKAAKLARAIMSDITLYHGDRIAQCADPRVDLASEIEEGRSLFRSRVAEAQHHVFEDALAAWSPPRGAAAPAPPAPKMESHEPKREVEEPDHFARNMLLIVFGLMLAGAISVVVYQTRRAAQEDRMHDTHDKHEGARH